MKVFSALAVLVTGCSLPVIAPTDTVAVSGEFDDEAITSILLAADEWNRATHGRVRLHMIIGDTDAHTIRVDNLGSRAGHTERSPLYSHVRIGIDMATIDSRAQPEQRSDVIRQVVMHELGHGFDLDHGQGLMAKRQHLGSRWACIDSVTVYSYCKLWGCPNGWGATCQ